MRHLKASAFSPFPLYSRSCFGVFLLLLSFCIPAGSVRTQENATFLPGLMKPTPPRIEVKLMPNKKFRLTRKEMQSILSNLRQEIHEQVSKVQQQFEFKGESASGPLIPGPSLPEGVSMASASTQGFRQLEPPHATTPQQQQQQPYTLRAMQIEEKEGAERSEQSRAVEAETLKDIIESFSVISRVSRRAEEREKQTLPNGPL